MLQYVIVLNALEREWILLKKYDWECTLFRYIDGFVICCIWIFCNSITLNLFYHFIAIIYLLKLVLLSSLCTSSLIPSGVFAFRYGNKEDACHTGWSFYSVSGAWKVQEFARMMLFLHAILVYCIFGLNKRNSYIS